MILSLFVGFILGAAAIVFALQNTAVVALSFFGWQFQSSLALLVLITLVMGILIALLVSIPTAVRDWFTMMGLKNENKRLVGELEAARKLNSTVAVETTPIPATVLDIRAQ